MKIETHCQFQIGFMFTITKWYKGERDIILSLPFIDLSIRQIQKKYRRPNE
jgi:hypothetical protein